ncbi:MAG TPA: hydroxysqualene dehydroxylase HpnE [Nocardioides sp.]|uniref:hydroxysqualene dehydroxylase HpnE n=1 Tax=Nocardioides sp. TaxID=35761 RepID=UPI002F41FCE3
MNAIRDVVVIGGGLAGITTALDCADAGHRVTLLEARPRLGGLTHSFRRESPQGELWVDNGQHVFLRCCTSYLRLLERLGVRDLVEIQPRLDVPVRSEERPGMGHLRRSALPAPLHLGSSLLRYRWLSPAERLRAAATALALGRLDRAGPAVDEQSFGGWLEQRGQTPRAVAALWDLIGIATLNARAADASLALAATVFQVGLLEHADAADIGWSRVPLQRLHGDAAAGALAHVGVEVRTSAKVSGLVDLGAGWQVGTESGTASYDDVVVATGPAAAEGLLPAGALAMEPGWAERLGSSPIVNAHLVLDRRVLRTPFVAAADGPLQWVFDRTEQSGLRTGQYLALSLSAADDLVGVPVADLREQLLPHLRRLLPDLARATIEEFFVTREPSATFRSAPGSSRWRPAATTAMTGLHVAGAWTDTGWPATMEGAVRSGEAAAASVIGRASDDGARPRAEEVAS